MVVKCVDNSKSSEIGDNDLLFSFYSTICLNLKKSRNEINDAIRFLDSGKCNASDCLSVARQFNLIRDKLSLISTDKIVFDMNDPNRIPPWKDNISPVVTSCGNFYTTNDGKDMIYEIICILVFGYYAETDVVIE